MSCLCSYYDFSYSCCVILASLSIVSLLRSLAISRVLRTKWEILVPTAVLLDNVDLSSAGLHNMSRSPTLKTASLCWDIFQIRTHILLALSSVFLSHCTEIYQFSSPSESHSSSILSTGRQRFGVSCLKLCN